MRTLTNLITKVYGVILIILGLGIRIFGDKIKFSNLPIDTLTQLQVFNITNEEQFELAKMSIAIIIIVMGILFFFINKLPLLIQLSLIIYLSWNAFINFTKNNITSLIIDIILILCIAYICYDSRKIKS